jgi:ABC-type Zn uptake system ZnuABC Zn-binding protein ZnuA
MKKTPFLVALIAAASVVVSSPARAQSKLNVMATTEDLASIAREIGGDHITVDSMAKGYQDPHFVEPKPSFILKLQRADLVVVGRELKSGVPPLINKAETARSRSAGKDIWMPH